MSTPRSTSSPAAQRHDLAHQHLTAAFAAYQRHDNQPAIDKCLAALAVDPDRPDGWTLLGVLYRRQKLYDRAIEAYQKAIQVQPSFIESHINLGNLCKELRRYPEAVTAYRRAVELRPGDAGIMNSLVDALRESSQYPEALTMARELVASTPDAPDSHMALGNVLLDMNRSDEAIACYQRAITIDPEHVNAYYNMGNALRDLCRAEDAASSYRRALALKPDFNRAHSNMLFTLQASPTQTVASLFHEHQLWEIAHGKPRRALMKPHRQTALLERARHDVTILEHQKMRPLHVGLVSADFGRHPVGFFLQSVVPHIDRRQFTLVCYSNRSVEDHLTRHFRAHADVWRSISRVEDDPLAEQIRADGIDILIDLSGHTQGNRMTLFAMKPAPVQATWAGYVGTTGLSAMDYLITDGYETPPGSEPFYVETLVRLPNGYVCYAPPDYAPAVAPLPALARGYVTFGCFNNLVKINRAVVELWCQILQRLPTARLLLMTRQLAVPDLRSRLRRGFAHAGVLDRVDMRADIPHHELLAHYGTIDIALDPFPYSGGLTTLESLWMGVPVITLGGDRFASRHSITHLANVGLPEGIVTSEANYVARAVAWASDLERLAAIRRGLRPKMAASPACDGARFASDLMSALRRMWITWCERTAARLPTVMDSVP
jgi:predicted O-linked N-acetylglucosamine transferase (SPINDLY family)